MCRSVFCKININFVLNIYTYIFKTNIYYIHISWCLFIKIMLHVDTQLNGNSRNQIFNLFQAILMCWCNRYENQQIHSVTELNVKLVKMRGKTKWATIEKASELCQLWLCCSRDNRLDFELQLASYSGP